MGEEAPPDQPQTAPVQLAVQLAMIRARRSGLQSPPSISCSSSYVLSLSTPISTPTAATMRARRRRTSGCPLSRPTARHPASASPQTSRVRAPRPAHGVLVSCENDVATPLEKCLYAAAAGWNSQQSSQAMGTTRLWLACPLSNPALPLSNPALKFRQPAPCSPPLLQPCRASPPPPPWPPSTGRRQTWRQRWVGRGPMQM